MGLGRCVLSVMLKALCQTPLSALLQRLLGEHEEVSLSALGMAVSTMVSIVEILKKDGLAVETRKRTAGPSTAAVHVQQPPRPICPKALRRAGLLGCHSCVGCCTRVRGFRHLGLCL